mmetsp:Transcript_29559/g.46351  ORF Transcript_29559/g.46351 Transcript_29559/m.46351 type:complete len:210 (+) Transcript_29559:60-689(+)
MQNPGAVRASVNKENRPVSAKAVLSSQTRVASQAISSGPKLHARPMSAQFESKGQQLRNSSRPEKDRRWSAKQREGRVEELGLASNPKPQDPLHPLNNMLSLRPASGKARTKNLEDEWSDGDFIEDDDDDDWDDGLEMDLPSTKRKFSVPKTAPSRTQVRQGNARRGAEGPGGPKTGADGPRSRVPLFLQWGQDDKARSKVLQQYSAFT